MNVTFVVVHVRTFRIRPCVQKANLIRIELMKSFLMQAFWTVVKRRIGDMDSGGGGVIEYLDGTGKYKALIGKKCNYGVRYLGDRNFHVHKCNFNKELLNKLKNN